MSENTGAVLVGVSLFAYLMWLLAPREVLEVCSIENITTTMKNPKTCPKCKKPMSKCKCK